LHGIHFALSIQLASLDVSFKENDASVSIVNSTYYYRLIPNMGLSYIPTPENVLQNCIDANPGMSELQATEL